MNQIFAGDQRRRVELSGGKASFRRQNSTSSCCARPTPAAVSVMVKSSAAPSCTSTGWSRDHAWPAAPASASRFSRSQSVRSASSFESRHRAATLLQC